MLVLGRVYTKLFFSTGKAEGYDFETDPLGPTELKERREIMEGRSIIGYGYGTAEEKSRIFMTCRCWFF